MALVHSVSDLISDLFSLYEVNGAESSEVSKEVSRGLLDPPLEFPDVKCFIGMQQELCQEPRSRLGSEERLEHRRRKDAFAAEEALRYHFDNKCILFDNGIVKLSR